MYFVCIIVCLNCSFKILSRSVTEVLVSFSAEEGSPWIYDRTFQWTPTAAVMDSGDLYLMFFAVDNYGVGMYYWPQLEVCACMNGATCSFDYLSTEQHHFNGGAELFFNSYQYGSFRNVSFLNASPPPPLFH